MEGCQYSTLVVGLLLFIYVSNGGSSSSSNRSGSGSPSSTSTQHHHPSPSSLTKSGSSSSSKTKPSSTIEDELDEDYEGEYKDDYKDDELPETPTERREWSSTTCPSSIRGHCHCGAQRDPSDHSKTRPVVNCTGAGLTSTDFFTHIPTDTVALFVVGNAFHSLPANLFGADRQLLALKELDLRNNGIVTIHGKTFHHIPNLETLILSFNTLSPRLLLDHPRIFSGLPSLKYLHLTGAWGIIPRDQELLLDGLSDTFVTSKLDKLLKLHLEQNHIARIPEPRLFCKLPSLLDLHLGQNELTDVVLEVEDCNPSLRYVDLSYNRVTGVGPSSGLFSLLQHTNQMGVQLRVELYHNPFKCDCTLDHFLAWMKNMTLKDPDVFRHRNGLRCAVGTPESNKMKMLLELETTACPPAPLTTTNTVIDRLSWTVVSLLALSALMVLAVLWLRTRGGGGGIGWLRLVTPSSSPSGQSLLSATTSGVKYVSVDKEEVAEVAHV